MLCPVVNCVCPRLVARRCPIEKKERKNVGWLGLTPVVPPDLSWDEQEKAREKFRIPDELWWDMKD